ncbi:MAG: hypothetical protein RL418_238 [Actinomycetota bacterium]
MIDVTITNSLPTENYQLAIPFQVGDQLPFTQVQLDLHKADSKFGAVARIATENGTTLIIGTGKERKLRDFAAHAVRAASDKFPLVLQASGEAEAKLLAEGAVLGQKTPTDYKKPAPANLDVQIVCNTTVDVAKEVEVAKLVVAIREVINKPANEIYPQTLADFALELTQGLPIEIEIWDEQRLEAERCGGILSVGKGSARPPRLVKLTYRGGGKHLALVGKGITFDTGGLSLKPAESMVGMKYDMAGAATVLGGIAGAAILGAKADITAFMCIAENMPSGTATRPGDVITIRNGKTVEVLNTDAEGRLVLADGLSLASELEPDHIIDVATLTGAATVALGNRYAGLMGQGKAIELCEESSERTDELLWRMPLPQELRDLLNSELADMANVKIGNRAGGMLIGGHFLKEFVALESSWAHLDIATSANNDSAAYGATPQGATGAMIRTLIDIAANLQ